MNYLCQFIKTIPSFRVNKMSLIDSIIFSFFFHRKKQEKKKPKKRTKNKSKDKKSKVLKFHVYFIMRNY